MFNRKAIINMEKYSTCMCITLKKKKKRWWSSEYTECGLYVMWTSVTVCLKLLGKEGGFFFVKKKLDYEIYNRNILYWAVALKNYLTFDKLENRLFFFLKKKQ